MVYIIIEVGGKLRIAYHKNLSQIDALSNIQKVGENVEIKHNLSGLQNINGLTGLLDIGGDLDIASNYELTQINGIKNVMSINGVIKISYNNSLLDFGEAFTKLENAEGIYINNSKMQTLNHFNALTHVNWISISDNENLNIVDGFDNLNAIKQLSIADNNLTQIIGFNNLKSCENLSFGGYLSIYSKLSKISGFSNLESINGNLSIDHSSLTNLNALTNVISVSGNISILNNPSLSDFCGIKDLIQSNGLSGNFEAFWNSYNPSENDLQNGNCIQ